MKTLSKHFKLALAVITIAAFSLTQFSCSDKDTIDFLTATIGHDGFDFSAGAPDTANWENNDGDVISWLPGGGTHPMYARNEYLRFRNGDVSADLGEVNFGDITEIPSTWDTLPPPLIVGHVKIIKCKDGYAKIKIKSVDVQAWTADIDYLFTSGDKF